MFDYQFPPIILEFLTTNEILELSLVSQQFIEEMWPILEKCKKKISDQVIIFFSKNRSTLISTHRSYHPDFEKNIKLLFYFILFQSYLNISK